MASRARQASVHVDRDGVRTVATARMSVVAWALLAIGLPILLTVVAVAVIRFAPVRAARPPQTVPVAETAHAQAPSLDAATRPRVADPAAPAGVAAAPPRDPAPSAPAPRSERVTPRRLASAGPRPAPEKDTFDIDARDAIPALIAAGEQGGITVFPLPGTDPPKAGVIVPEGFPLPEGFVRHYQSTDDGERLPAILMVHPDYQLVDEHGTPVVAPGGVVPPELAPAGMEVHMLEPPEKPRASAPAP
jgi:hypothetical protein